MIYRFLGHPQIFFLFSKSIVMMQNERSVGHSGKQVLSLEEIK